MTGLAAGWDHAAFTQGRAGDAEHDVELLLAFLNTRDLELGTDVLDSAAAWRAWVAERGLGRAGDPDEVRAARTCLRASLGERHDGPDPTPVAGFIRVDLSHGVPTMSATDALGAVLGAAARLVVLGSWERFKICQADDCRWAFFDRSRNRSRTWCSMQTCGNREKARNWRERRALSMT
ncbi:CGNR zinc finger domain-containing protein [Saccharothrix sp. S26]|uniref:CGNR zinc finger domain-containing protein n=1 Tax=Saccharothrix sp. S26 TaxID=2907215 RepID=UPI001F397D54|nr:CGNR zinc finger domain-containing protein [Saccharothrix sp. S26]MCE6995815.1 CGNR zinc finger domain-containing protein [Saccharothrix sp. S26]